MSPPDLLAAAQTLSEVSPSFTNYPTTEDTNLFSPWLLTAVMSVPSASLLMTLVQAHVPVQAGADLLESSSAGCSSPGAGPCPCHC